MTRALRACLCLAALLLPYGAGHAERPQRLGFLRAYPQAEPAPAPERRPEPEAENPARQALARDEFKDPHNADAMHLQRHDEAMAGLPKDANGFPDWMRALREGRIQPRAGLAPGAAPMEPFDLDIIMKRTKEMPYVRFPHKPHTEWLDCSNCHPAPFEARTGSAQIAMADIFRGKYCGMCHDRVAFISFLSCQRCHSVPRTAAREETSP